jgi:hypothetical protein
MTQIIYPKAGSQASFLGRNGYYQSKGIEITHLSCGLIALQPTTTKGHTGRCTIELPADAETLRQVAKALLELAETI